MSAVEWPALLLMILVNSFYMIFHDFSDFERGLWQSSLLFWPYFHRVKYSRIVLEKLNRKFKRLFFISKTTFWLIFLRSVWVLDQLSQRDFCVVAPDATLDLARHRFIASRNFTVEIAKKNHEFRKNTQQ